MIFKLRKIVHFSFSSFMEAAAGGVVGVMDTVGISVSGKYSGPLLPQAASRQSVNTAPAVMKKNRISGCTEILLKTVNFGILT